MLSLFQQLCCYLVNLLRLTCVCRLLFDSDRFLCMLAVFCFDPKCKKFKGYKLQKGIMRAMNVYLVSLLSIHRLAT